MASAKRWYTLLVLEILSIALACHTSGFPGFRPPPSFVGSVEAKVQTWGPQLRSLEGLNVTHLTDEWAGSLGLIYAISVASTLNYTGELMVTPRLDGPKMFFSSKRPLDYILECNALYNATLSPVLGDIPAGAFGNASCSNVNYTLCFSSFVAFQCRGSDPVECCVGVCVNDANYTAVVQLPNYEFQPAELTTGRRERRSGWSPTWVSFGMGFLAFFCPWCGVVGTNLRMDAFEQKQAELWEKQDEFNKLVLGGLHALRDAVKMLAAYHQVEWGVSIGICKPPACTVETGLDVLLVNASITAHNITALVTALREHIAYKVDIDWGGFMDWIYQIWEWIKKWWWIIVAVLLGILLLVLLGPCIFSCLASVLKSILCYPVKKAGRVIKGHAGSTKYRRLPSTQEPGG